MIKAPNYVPHSTPGKSGWYVGSELVTARQHSQAELNEWNEAKTPKPKKKKRRYKKKAKIVEKAIMLTEAPIGNKSLSEMTKEEIKALEEQNNIKVDMNQQTLFENL